MLSRDFARGPTWHIHPTPDSLNISDGSHYCLSVLCYVGKTKKYKTAKKIERFLEGFEPEDESWMKFILQCFAEIAYIFHNKEFQVPPLSISKVGHIWIK